MKSLIKSQEGSLLILVISFLMVMSLFALSIGYGVQQRLQVASRLERREKLRYIAEAGVKKALSVLGEEDKRPPVFNSLLQRWSHNEAAFKNIEVGEGSFSVLGLPVSGKDKSKRFGMIDEESKININKAPQDVLTRLFHQIGGASAEEAQTIALSLLDWRDADEDARDLGAESNYYMSLNPPYGAKNTDLNAPEELLYVKGMTLDIFEKILPYISLIGESKININTASPEVLSVLGLSDPIIAKIATFRRGRDGVAATPDDGVFKMMGTVTKSLQDFAYMDPAEVEMMTQFEQSGKIDVMSRHFSVESIARLKRPGDSLVVHAVVTKSGDIKQWHEEFLKIPA